MIPVDGRHRQTSVGVCSGLLSLAGATEGRDHCPVAPVERSAAKNPEETAFVRHRQGAVCMALSVLSAGYWGRHDHPTRDGNRLAPGTVSDLVALEIAQPWRSAEDRPGTTRSHT